MDEKLVTYVFGPESRGTSPWERALSSLRHFVRDQDHLALDSPAAKGRRFTAFEALEAYGIEKLEECIEFGSAVLPYSKDEPSVSLKLQRERLGLSVKSVASKAAVSNRDVLNAENSTLRSPIKILERIGVALGLDERYLSVRAGSGRDDALAVRLRTMRGGAAPFSEGMVLTLSQAAWVVRTQARLQAYFGMRSGIPPEFTPSSNYGDIAYPTWKQGFFLARRTREILSISEDSSIDSLRSVCSRLGVPLISVSLPAKFAGATIAVGGARGIVVNTEGNNKNVWVRRSTVAHELGHLLWDPAPELASLRVDLYADLEASSWPNKDKVEARANAFAVEFLAPSSAVERVFKSSVDSAEGLRNVMGTFGISLTAARFHVANALNRTVDTFKIRLGEYSDTSPNDEWIGRESYTNDYFPLPNTSQLRRGEFAGWVVAAERSGFISEDSAATYLETSVEDYRESYGHIMELYPEITGKMSAMSARPSSQFSANRGQS